MFSFLGEYRAGRDEGAQADHRPVAPCFGSSLFRNAATPHGAFIAQADYIIKSNPEIQVTIIDNGARPWVQLVRTERGWEIFSVIYSIRDKRSPAGS